MSAFGLVVLAGGLIATPPVSGASDVAAALNAPMTSSRNCPWVGQSLHHLASPSTLAREVLDKMSLTQKVNFVILKSGDGLQSFNTGVPSLCIPALTLSDGPDGIAGRMTGVTQLPAEIAIASTFNPIMASSVGKVIGAEARTKGIDVVQGPGLNVARVPLDGRVFETYGEDPYLASVLAVADIQGIQSEGAMALAKHFSAYTQETARTRLDQIVPLRALAEIYDVPFEAAVEIGHVAGLMCSVGFINSVQDCADPYLYSTLQSWGFTGFMRSDERGAPHAAKAFDAGLALIKPAAASTLIRLVKEGRLPTHYLNRAVSEVLTEMFDHGLIAHHRAVTITARARTRAHARVALLAAEQGVVLLKNAGSDLPISKDVKSVAIIGTDARTAPLSTGGGSSLVIAPFVITPLKAIRSALGPHVHVTYSSGAPSLLNLHSVSDSQVVSGSALPVPTFPKEKGNTDVAGKADLYIDSARNVSAAIATAARPGAGKGWSHWDVVLRAHETGLYEVSMQQIGDTWFYLNGQRLAASEGLHAPSLLTATVRLRAHRRYKFSARWFSVPHHGSPGFGIADDTPEIKAAVAIARKARVAIVFVGEYSTEGADRPDLELSGDANALIKAVSAVNPRTIVVLNTGGAVVMPWLDRVAGVLEAWYPGEEDGRAIAAILTGTVDPSGRLPITFPTSLAAQPMTALGQYPGVDSVTDYGTPTKALDVGYRWYQANNVTPLFPFGFGLDYTTFHLSDPTLQETANGVVVHLTVTNTGAREGADVVQAYVQYPSSVAEPPEQLRAFVRVALQPSSSRQVTLTIPRTGFQAFLNGSFEIVPGQYGVNVGQSSANLAIHLEVNLSRQRIS
jgi:beta-glucosidase